MARAALIAAVAALTCAAPAGAGELSLQLGFGTGVGWASRAGLYRDDGIGVLRVGVGIGRYLALDFGLSEDAERIEAALRAGVRVLPFTSPCWHPTYFRGEIAAVGASHLGSNYDLLAGVGRWEHLTHWFALYGELDTVARVGEVETIAARLEVGIAITH